MPRTINVLNCVTSEDHVYSAYTKPYRKSYEVEIILSKTEMKYLTILKDIIETQNKDPLFLKHVGLKKRDVIQIAIDNIRPFCTIGDPENGIGTGEDITFLTKELPSKLCLECEENYNRQVNTIVFIYKEVLRILIIISKKLQGKQIQLKFFPSYKVLQMMRIQLKRVRFSEVITNSDTIRSYMLRVAPKFKPIEEDVFACYTDPIDKCEYEYYKKYLSRTSVIFKLVQPSDFYLACGKEIGWLSVQDICMLKIYYCFLRYVPIDKIKDANTRQNLCELLWETIQPFLKGYDYKVKREGEASCSYKEIVWLMVHVLKRVESHRHRYTASMDIIFNVCNLIPPPHTWLRFVDRNK